jgi:hypothetical protein
MDPSLATIKVVDFELDTNTIVTKFDRKNRCD